MTTLTTRLAEATEPTRELLLEAFNLVHPPRRRSEAEWKALGDATKAFAAMLDAEAWTSAVEMLMPADTDWTLSVAAYQPCLVTIPSEDAARYRWLRGDDRKDAVHGYAATPALALAIACLKVRGL